MTALACAFYVSCSKATDGDVQRILETSLRNNPIGQISGMLLFTGGHFAQFLEGPPEPLRAVMTRIVADTRHTGVLRLVDEPIEQRAYADWLMAYHESPGADDLLAEVTTAAQVGPERARRLMHLLFPASRMHPAA